MTANLLAHSDMFRAGIARSGAYNRTLTPFGFQAEERTYWEAPDVYFKMSPFSYADKIKAPVLLIHGEADDNQGTFPIQSERFYVALKGHGATVRLVFLPLEAHGYETSGTSNGFEALDLVRTLRPDLILMDIQLPQVSGLEVTRWIKDDPELRAIPVVAVTAFAMKGDEERIREGGCEAYLSKPISVGKFIETVRRFIG